MDPATSPSTLCLVAQYAAVGLIGAAVGAGELVSRYRDNPLTTLLSKPAVLYLIVNVLAAFLSLYVLIAYDVDLSDKAQTLTRTLAAGFGAMAVFRTSLFTARVGGSDVQVGPSLFLQVILAALDRAVDQHQAGLRASAAKEAMQKVVFAKAWATLAPTCFNLMKYVPEGDQRRVGEKINELKGQNDISDAVKSFNLGLVLIDVVGPEVLKSAIETLGNEIR